MKRLHGYGEFAVELCKAFGENPNKIRCLDLHVSVDDAVTCKFEKFVNEENAEPIISVIKKVVWVEDNEIGENNG